MSAPREVAHGDPEVKLLDVAAVLLREWKVIAGSVLALTLFGVAFALIRPREYTATTVLLPIGEGGRGSSAGARAEALSGSLPMAALNLGSLASGNQQMIAAVIESRTVKEAVYRASTQGAPAEVQEEAQNAIGNAGIKRKLDDGSISVSVTSSDPALSARIANGYATAVNQVAQRLIIESAQRKQRFLEGQLEQARERLVESEEELLRFQRRQSAPEVQAQAERTVEAAATAQQAINEQEVRVAELRRTLGPDNPQLRTAESELATRRAQLRRITAGSGSSSVYVPLSNTANLRVAISRLTREFAKNEAIYNTLTGSLAQARIDANNNLPAINVLDPAPVPRTPSGGSRSLIVLASVLLGLCIGVVTAFVRHQIRRSRGLPEATPLGEAWNQFRSDITFGRSRPNGRITVP